MELLIVIALIGILAATVISVINPVRQRQKAQEGVAKSNIAKICQALVACQSSLSTPNAANCGSFDLIGVIQPTQPTGAVYSIGGSGTGLWDYAYARVITAAGCWLTCVVYNGFYDWPSAGTRPGTVVNDAGTCVTQ